MLLTWSQWNPSKFHQRLFGTTSDKDSTCKAGSNQPFGSTLKTLASIDSKKNAPVDEKVELIKQFADDMKAENIEVVPVRDKSALMDFMIVCSGTSDTHVNAIAEKVGDRLRDLGIKPLRTNVGPKSGGWTYFDFGDVVFHVMLEEKREFYDLETLWKTTPADPNLIV